MFVDDSLFAEIRKFMLVAMAGSIEALYKILGYPDKSARQNCLSLDKFYVAICSYLKIQLGKEINTRTMLVTMTEEKISKLIQ